MGKKELVVLAVSLVLAVIAFVKRSTLVPALKKWWFEPVHPLNLAIFRIVLFVVLFVTADLPQNVFFASLPHSLRYPPMVTGGLEWPMGPGITYWLTVVFKGLCILGMLGIWARPVAALTAVLGIYVIGLANFFGKVNHAHHEIWCAALLAFAPSADVLSVDAVWKGWRQADRGIVAQPQAASAYGVPLKAAIALIGLAYFFAGFWKFFVLGPAWASAENIRAIMYGDWLMMGHWLPPIRLDGMPLVLAAGGFGSIAFEVAWLPLAMIRRTRWMAVAAGLMFHNMTYLNLGIRFGTLQAMYVALIDWTKPLRWLGAKLFRSKAIFLYDGSCSFCRRTAATLVSLEMLGRVEFFSATDPNTWPAEVKDAPDQETLLTDVYVTVGGKWFAGIDAYAQMVARMPLLWIAWPFLALPPFKNVAKAAYRHIADRRVCKLLPKAQPDPIRPPSQAITIFALSLWLVNFVFSTQSWINAWPIGCYPSYAYKGPATNKTPLFVMEQDGNAKTLNPTLDPAMKHAFLPNRLNGLLQKMRQDKAAAWGDFFAVWQRVNPDIASAKLTSVLEAELDNRPEKWDDPPVATRTLWP